MQPAMFVALALAAVAAEMAGMGSVAGQQAHEIVELQHEMQELEVDLSAMRVAEEEEWNKVSLVFHAAHSDEDGRNAGPPALAAKLATMKESRKTGEKFVYGRGNVETRKDTRVAVVAPFSMLKRHDRKSFSDMPRSSGLDWNGKIILVAHGGQGSMNTGESWGDSIQTGRLLAAFLRHSQRENASFDDFLQNRHGEEITVMLMVCHGGVGKEGGLSVAEQIMVGMASILGGSTNSPNIKVFGPRAQFHQSEYKRFHVVTKNIPSDIGDAEYHVHKAVETQEWTLEDVLHETGTFFASADIQNSGWAVSDLRDVDEDAQVRAGRYAKYQNSSTDSGPALPGTDNAFCCASTNPSYKGCSTNAVRVCMDGDCGKGGGFKILCALDGETGVRQAGAPAECMFGSCVYGNEDSNCCDDPVENTIVEAELAAYKYAKERVRELAMTAGEYRRDRTQGVDRGTRYYRD